MGLGIDLLEIDRLEAALERRPGLAERVFTEGERAYASSQAHPARHLAARFAAKEAVIKALGGPDGVGLGDIEVVGSKPPTIRLHGRAAEIAAGETIEISLTHSDNYAAAVALRKAAADVRP